MKKQPPLDRPPASLGATIQDMTVKKGKRIACLRLATQPCCAALPSRGLERLSPGRQET